MSFDFSLFFYAFGLIVPLFMIIRFPNEITIVELCAHIAAVMLVMFLGYQLGKFASVADSFVAHGEITGKERVHGSYIETYTCNCRSTGKTTTCSVCTRMHYTVDWNAKSTVGKIDIDYADWLSPAVYALPDPKIYKNCKNGDPATKSFGYTNYVRAVDNSLFAESSTSEERKSFRKSLNKYPRIYDAYHYDHVISGTGRAYPQIENALSLAARQFGKKGPNPIVVVTQESGRDFMKKIEKYWKSGKLNDIVILVGVDAQDNIKWTDAFSYGKSYKNQDVLATIRNYLTDVGNISTVEGQSNLVSKIGEILGKYEVTTSKDFEYLKHEVQPHPVVQWLLIIFGFLLSGFLSFWFHQNDLTEVISRYANRYY